MARPRSPRVALALLAGAWLFSGQAARAGPREVVRGLQAWLDGTRDLACRFEQSLVSGALGPGVPESGTLYLLRPGKARWDYADPEPKTAILDGENTRVYLPEDHQMIRGRLPAESAAFHAFLTGASRVDDLFVASVVAPPRGQGNGIRLRLVPRRESDTFEALLLELDPSSFAIEAAEVADGAGNVIRYRFHELRRNRGVREETFHFQPPPGTEIIEAP